jgi:hypothetical protein
MKKTKVVTAEVPSDDLGCLREFNAEDRMCLKFCALSLRCAIESNHHIRAEIMDELMYLESFSEKNQ